MDDQDVVIWMIERGEMRAFPDGQVIGKRGKPIGVRPTANGGLKINMIHPETGQQVPMNKARFVWIALRGRIPKDLVVAHLNLDKTDTRLENLALMTHSEMLKRVSEAGGIGGGRGSVRQATRAELQRRIAALEVENAELKAQLAVRHTQ